MEQLSLTLLVFALGFTVAYHWTKKQHHQFLESSFGKDWRRILAELGGESLKDAKTNKVRIARQQAVIQKLGAGIFILGNDIANQREGGIVNSSSEQLRKSNGRLISTVGNYFREFGSLQQVEESLSEKNPEQIAEMFYQALDNREVEQDLKINQKSIV